jgi:uroporphyrinogen-III synthase
MPTRATSEALGEQLIATGSLDSAKVLMIVGNLNREALVQQLEDARAIVDRLQVYKTEKGDLSCEPSAELFASSSAVDSYVAQNDLLKLAPSAVVPLLGSIGHQTSESIRTHGLTLGFEAKTPSIEALVDALVTALSAS